jgi:hypothetical protein
MLAIACGHHGLRPVQLQCLPDRPLQDRDHNFALSLFWNYWWPVMFIIYPFIGRIW